MDVPWPAEEELAERLAVIHLAADRFIGVNSYEHLLLDLLRLLQSDRVPRTTATEFMFKLVEEWGAGAVEILEFTMRTLQWPEVREALLAHAHKGEDFRTRGLARHALEVYEAQWPNGEIYRTYRET